MDTKIIALANQKGGVGKTTTCVNLAAALTILKSRVLLVDLDPQGNATMGSGVDKSNIDSTVNEVLLGDLDISDVLISSVPAGFDLLPANSDLTVSEVALLKMSNREQRLAQALETVKDNYDFILIDCPPALNALTLNGLVAAHSILIPMQCEYYALEGLTGLLGTISQVQKINPTLGVEGIVRTMYDSRNRLSEDVSAQLYEYFGDKVYNTVIPRNIRLAEAPSHGMPIFLYDGNSKGATSYLSLARELLHGRDAAFKSESDTKNILVEDI